MERGEGAGLQVMILAEDWKDYELLECSQKEKLERWGKYYLLRPDPQIIWDTGSLRENPLIDAYYHRSDKGGGYWENEKNLPLSWEVSYKNLRFLVKPMGFKHTGLFPEQAVNWDFMMDKIEKAHRPIRVLNLFAYTGGATVACLKKKASVTHVDSSRGMVDWAKENVKLNGLEGEMIRYIVDDVVKFVKREIRRGNHYDAIIMDPPSYGRGSNNEVWNIEKDLYPLVELCTELLSDQPLFFILNTYTTGLSKEVFTNILHLTVGKKYQGKIYSHEIGLPIQKENLVLPCGICSRFESYE